jgi:hypothetical protein
VGNNFTKNEEKKPLGANGKLGWIHPVSATELIKQVAALPQRERTRFDQLFQALKNSRRAPGQTAQSPWPDFGERLRGIYRDRVAPDSQSIIDETRGEG